MSTRWPVRLAAAGVAGMALAVGANPTATSSDVPSTMVSGVARPAAVAAQFGVGQSSQDVALVAMFDRDGDGRLGASERVAARDYAESAGIGRTRGNRGGWYGPAAPGPALAPEDVRPYPDTALFDPSTVRTLFLTFENADWERELMAFKATDVDVPASLVVDGRTYRDVGVQFHGNSSFNVPMGFKHSMRLALDFVHEDQALLGFRTLLLLNVHEDPSFVRTFLAMRVAREYYPAPRANLVRLVINGESWGIYVNQQQFNGDMTRDLFASRDGARWKIQGTRGYQGGGLAFLGEQPAAYRYAYEIRSKDTPHAWASLIQLTRALNMTPPAQLEAALEPMLDIDATLRFLAVENVIVNTDGYWTKASDYSLYMDLNGKFHLLPYDVNGTFATGFGPAGSRTGSLWLDPLEALGDPSKALISRLLAVPALRAKYLEYVRDVATTWLDWDRLGPIVSATQAMVDADVRTDTRKLTSYESFLRSAAELREFANQRRAILLGMTAAGTTR